MPAIIVSDTSCLVLFDKLGKLDLLKSLFGKITVTDIIKKEFGKPMPEFIKVKNPKNKVYQKVLENTLDSGEASALALALEEPEHLLIIDEYIGRKEAKRLQLTVTGTMGILIRAKEKGLISSVSEIIAEIEKTNVRLSESLIEEVKKKCGE